jgi:hypothetical protein
MVTYSISMSALKCQEKDIQKRRSKKLFVMQKIMDGMWKSGVAMPGAEFTAQIMTKTVGAGNSALQVFGVRRLAHPIMAGKSGGLSITALPVKTTKSGSAT